MLIFTVEREVSLVHAYSKLLRRFARTSYKLFPVSVLFVCCCFYLHVCLFVAVFIFMFVCLIDLVMFYLFLFSFYLFLTLVHLTSIQTLRFPSSVYG